MLARLLCPLALLALPVLETGPARRLASPWAGWVSGSWVTLAIDNSLTGAMTNRQSLVSVDEATCTLREQLEWPGGRDEQQVVVSLARSGYPHALEDAQQVATETLTVDGRELECQVWRARFTDDGQDWDVIAWVAPEIDQPLRIRTRSRVSFDLEVTRLEDYVTIARRKFRCLRYEGHVSAEGRRSAVTQWRSSEIPGALVKSVTVSDLPEGQVTHTVQVEQFRGTRLK